MGTRSLTYVYDSNDPVICMYGQWDGYPSGYGMDLSNFLNSFDCLVNGIPVGDSRKLANGMGCLAAQLVANFKKDVGSFYLYPPVVGQDCGQEYEYHVYEDRVIVKGYDDDVIFSGSWTDFAEFCSEDYVA